MALTKQNVTIISIDKWSTVSYTVIKEIYDDGVLEGTKVVSTASIFPGDDYSAHPPKIRKICADVHDQAAIDAWAAYRATILSPSV